MLSPWRLQTVPDDAIAHEFAIVRVYHALSDAAKTDRNE
jgi:hypothetical protein